MGTQAEGADLDDAWDLMKFYGWKDTNGECATFKAWARPPRSARPTRPSSSPR